MNRKKNFNTTTPKQERNGSLRWQYTVAERMSAIEHGTTRSMEQKLRKMDAEYKDHLLRYAVENSLTVLDTDKGVVLLSSPDCDNDSAPD